MDANRDAAASLKALLKTSTEAARFYEYALEERGQVVINAYGALPPLRVFGDAALLGRAFPPPSARLWEARLNDPFHAGPFSSIDVVGKRITRAISNTRLFINRVVDVAAAKSKLDYTNETIRTGWVARQASNEVAQTQEDRDRDARVARAFECAVHLEAARLANLEECARRFGADDGEFRPQPNAAGGLGGLGGLGSLQLDAKLFLEAELRDDFRSQYAEIDKSIALLAGDWSRRHARDLDALRRGQIRPSGVSKLSGTWGIPYASLPDPLDWSAETLRVAHRQLVLEVSDHRFTLDETVRELSTAHASHKLSKLCVLVRHAALQQRALDDVAQSTDDWTAPERYRAGALQPLVEQYEHALETMVARSARWQSAWEKSTYGYLITLEDVQEHVTAEIFEPISSEACAKAVRETERAAKERIRLTELLDLLVSEYGADLALADAMANQCTEALLVREMRNRNPMWPETVQDLVDAVNTMLVQPTWRERNHRGSRGADEAMDRIYEWVLRLQTGQDFYNRHNAVYNPGRAGIRAQAPIPHPLSSRMCTSNDDENANDINGPLMPCTLSGNATADELRNFAVADLHCQKKELPTLSIAAVTAYRRRLLR